MLPRDAFERRDEVSFLDVREPHEYEAGHLEGSVHVPLMSLPEATDRLDSDTTWVIVCQIGQRSDMAARFLRTRGYDAHNLDGGVTAWAALGLPLVGTSETPGTIADGYGRILDWGAPHEEG